MKEKKALSKIQIDIDDNSGFCFGVVNAIKKAEENINASHPLVSLGKIVHNQAEVDRLNNLGLQVIDNAGYEQLKSARVLFRAHGEAPIRYQQAKENNIEIIDATCPVVLKLQQRIAMAYQEGKSQNGQVVIYGKKGHAEVNGLAGQTNNEAIIVQGDEDLSLIDKDKSVWLFAQTTQSIEGFQLLAKKIESMVDAPVKVHDTICRQVANRAPKLKEFVKNYDLVFFVSGVDSSNGKYLYSVCKQANAETHFISDVKQIDTSLLKGIERIGICGATSTPQWQMEEVAEELRLIVSR